MRPHRAPSLPPIPGTERAPRGLFVGRWGALLERPAAGHCRSFEEARLTPRAGETLFRAGQSGWRVYLVSNEPAVARGRLSDLAWEEFQRDLHAHLAGLGVRIARDYACLDHPQGKGKHKRDSVFRFPNTGALYHAVQEDGVELRASWIVSDDVHELAAASRAGVRTISLAPTLRLGEAALEVECDERAACLAEAIDHILAGDPLRRR
jgi:histidinol phosphatase-like enzyme